MPASDAMDGSVGGRSTIALMKRLLLFAALVAFLVWRDRRLAAHDRAHGFGPYAEVTPVARS